MYIPVFKCCFCCCVCVCMLCVLFLSCLTVNRSKWGGAMMKETCIRWTSPSRWFAQRNVEVFIDLQTIQLRLLDYFFFSLLFLGVCVCRVLVFIDVDRGEGEDSSSLHLASFQGPDNEEILSRIDLLKKNAVSFSSGNQPQRDEAQQQPSLLFSSSRMVTMSPPTTPGTSRNGH